jgi:hypothetical protein
VLIDRELVGFRFVSKAAPWKLEGCARGSHGTPKAAHPAGTRVAKMITMRYGKDIFFGNRQLGLEVIQNCARICNEAKLDHWCFDGMESNEALGVGGYGRDIFLDTWNAGLSPERRNHVMLESSGMDNYGWHSFFSGNWGEPWYDSFRKSMLQYRLEMVRFHARNYLPPMLGQFFVHPGGEKIEDIEWLMALSTGYNAGFSLTFGENGNSYMHGEPVSSTKRIRVPNLDAIASTIRIWRQASRAGAFPDEIKAELQDPDRDFHLTASGPGEWELHRVKPAGPAVRLKAQPQAH